MKGLIREAAKHGIRVSLAHIREIDDDLLGFYDHDASEIVVDIGLTRAQRRAVLAHELGHAVFCHTCDSPKGERQADRFAAELLVDPVAYAMAESMSDDVEYIATELDVTADVIEDYRRYCLEKIGDVTYSTPRMGVGQWRHRSATA